MHTLVVVVMLALLPPEARRLNGEALDHYDAGRRPQAIESFLAAYATIPADRENNRHRESLLGSIRGALLDEHEHSGEAAPLCRLREVLQAHVASVRTIFAGEPGRREIVDNVRRVGMVETHLAAYPPGVCEPAPPPVATPSPVTAPSVDEPPASVEAPLAQAASPAPDPASVPDVRPRLRIAGGVSLGLGSVLLGAMTAGVVEHARVTARLDARASGLAPGQPLDPTTWKAVQDDLDAARRYRGLAVGTGISAALALGAGVTLFILARGRARDRLVLAPWWMSSGTGLIVRVHLP